MRGESRKNIWTKTRASPRRMINSRARFHYGTLSCKSQGPRFFFFPIFFFNHIFEPESIRVSIFIYIYVYTRYYNTYRARTRRPVMIRGPTVNIRAEKNPRRGRAHSNPLKKKKNRTSPPLRILLFSGRNYHSHNDWYEYFYVYTPG